jgi:hypothetical protein
VTLPPSSDSVPSSSLPFHNISPSAPSTAHHFLKSFTVTCAEMFCHTIMTHTDWILHLYILVYNLLEIIKFIVYSTVGVKNLLPFVAIFLNYTWTRSGIRYIFQHILWYLVIENDSVKVVHQVLCLKIEPQLASEMLWCLKKLDDWHGLKK